MRTFAIGTVLIVIVAVAAIFLATRDRDISTASRETQQEKQSSEDVVESDQQADNSAETETSSERYKEYTPEAIANTDGDIVLFFYAKWCPTCNRADKLITESLDEIPEDLTILIIDYDDSDELKKKYNITYQHTFVQVDNNGKELTKWYGSYTIDEIKEKLI